MIETERRYRQMIDSLPMAIYTTDAQGILTHFNPAAVELAGRTPELGKDRWCVSWKLYHPDGTPMPLDQCPMAAALREGRNIRGVEAILERPDGTRRWFMPYATPVRDANDKIVGGVNMLVDITERKQAEQDLLHAKAMAETANRAKTEFLSRMSHELRTPLTAILGFAQLMESDATSLTDLQKDSTNQILQAGWFLLELITEILDLALIESGRLLVSVEPIALSDILPDCHALVERQAHQYGVTLSFCSVDDGFFVLADRTRLKQVLINFLTNAIKYNQPGGAVTVDCFLHSADRIRITVKDTGPGLSPEQLTHLFEPFNRLGQESSGEEGSGIGLTMAKRLAELMGGMVGVESVVGEGSTFWVDFARAVNTAPATDAGGVPALRPSDPAQDIAQPTVLCVEDNPATLKLIEQLVARRPNVRLVSAEDATKGLALARELQPQAILMDINLPGISGVRAVEILRDDPLIRHIPVIAISANALPADISKGLKAGFSRYLTKPIKVDQFTETLDEVLTTTSTASTRVVQKHQA